ncbi:unnamed protein product [Boreogadus saida]
MANANEAHVFNLANAWNRAQRRPGPVTVGRFQVTRSSEAVATAARPPSAPGARAATAPGARPAVVPGARPATVAGARATTIPGARPGGGSSTSSPAPSDPPPRDGRNAAAPEHGQAAAADDGKGGGGRPAETKECPRATHAGSARRRSRKRTCSLSLLGTSADSGLSVTAADAEGGGRLWDGGSGSPQYTNALHHLWTMTYSRSSAPPRDGRNAAAPEHGQAAAADDGKGGGGRPAETKECPRATHAGSARRRSRKRTCSLSLLGTSADSGLSVTAADAEGGGRLWDGGSGSPQYTNALHHLWTMTYSRSSAPYVSSDAF